MKAMNEYCLDIREKRQGKEIVLQVADPPTSY